MSNIQKGVVIKDAEFQTAAKDIAEYSLQLNDVITLYVEGVSEITRNGIQSQRLSKKLSSLCEQMTALQEPLNIITSEVQDSCRKYIADVDSADQFLY